MGWAGFTGGVFVQQGQTWQYSVLYVSGSLSKQIVEPAFLGEVPELFSRYTLPGPLVQVVQPDFGDDLRTADSRCNFQVAGENIGEQHGVEGTYHSPRNSFQETSEVRFLYSSFRGHDGISLFRYRIIAGKDDCLTANIEIKPERAGYLPMSS